ncbi:hypothetical protein FB451DRAFT_1345085 [Mycena latifolia]|nr:hypothetical protein FB451DRAFT_1345085 [Mycena latifolia]
MSAAARAEARRKAILSRGTDRLAKLTTSGRGEDSEVYSQDVADPPLPSFGSSTTGSNNTANFVGEETAGMPDPSAWSAEQQAQFMQALMGGAPPPGGAGGGGSPFGGMGENISPFAALMNARMGAGMGNGIPGAEGEREGPFAPGTTENMPFAAMMGAAGAGAGIWPSLRKGPTAANTPPPKTRAQRLMPALHLAAMWALLAYFVVLLEPAAAGGGAEERGTAWRWRQLAPDAQSRVGGVAGVWGVQLVPFFWAFVTLELALHSLRIFSGFDAFRPPMLLALALPHLPPPIPAMIVHGMKYLQMGSLFLDDVAAVIVGIGLIIWLATWRAT